MKKILLCVVSASVVLFSCKKEHINNPPPGSKTYPVTLSVGFAASVRPFKTLSTRKSNTLKTMLTGTDTLKDLVNKICYQVYNSSGLMVRSGKQSSSDTDFGTFSENLPAGTYSVAIIAGANNDSSPLDSLSNLYAPTAAPYDFSYEGSGHNGNPWGDSFFKKLSITVGSTGTNTFTASLDRIVAQLEVNIEDSIPAGATVMKIKVINDNQYFDPVAGAPYFGEAFTHTFAAGAVGATNTKYNAIVLNTTTSFSVEIICTDATGNTIYKDKTIPNVTCMANETTIVTGKLFTSSIGNAKFSVTYDPEWNPTPVSIGF